MIATYYRIDLSNVQTINTGSSDASVTLNDSAQNPLWLMVVTGVNAYLNVNAAATSSNVLHPMGRDSQPYVIPAGTVVHALASAAGSGQVAFIRCYPIEVRDD